MAAPSTNRGTLGLYIHWPFCVQRCTYCAFVSCVETGLQDEYRNALLNEITAAGRVQKSLVDTVFIGGGTPSCAPPGTIYEIMNHIRRNFEVDPSAEITIEANPESVTAGKLREWKEAGINRLSMGLQATQPRHLRCLGRAHTLDDFIEAYETARTVRFDNISVDLMYGLPEQSRDEWISTLNWLADLAPEHISCYALSIEDGTRLNYLERNGHLSKPDEDAEAGMFRDAHRILQSAGYAHYEISNFALQGRECRHNLKYWVLLDYLGLGAAAHSMIGRLRFSNSESVEQYIKDHAECTVAPSSSVRVSDTDHEDEFMMLRTRLREGFTGEEYMREFGCDVFSKHAAGLKACISDGLLALSGDRIRPTVRGFLFQNQIALRLMGSDGS